MQKTHAGCVFIISSNYNKTAAFVSIYDNDGSQTLKQILILLTGTFRECMVEKLALHLLCLAIKLGFISVAM
jgi:hypothetical protein